MGLFSKKPPVQFKADNTHQSGLFNQLNQKAFDPVTGVTETGQVGLDLIDDNQLKALSAHDSGIFGDIATSDSSLMAQGAFSTGASERNQAKAIKAKQLGSQGILSEFGRLKGEQTFQDMQGELAHRRGLQSTTLPGLAGSMDRANTLAAAGNTRAAQMNKGPLGAILGVGGAVAGGIFGGPMGAAAGASLGQGVGTALG